MSNVYTAFRNIDGETAFLAGTVDALCGAYLAKSCPEYHAVETDVFALPDNLDFSEMLRGGLNKYLSLTREPEKTRNSLKTRSLRSRKSTKTRLRLLRTFSQGTMKTAIIAEAISKNFSEILSIISENRKSFLKSRKSREFLRIITRELCVKLFSLNMKNTPF